jgi:hypothetical protein
MLSSITHLALLTAPSIAGLSRAARQSPRVQRDFDLLLERMRRRLYPETMDVLALYWLKTIYASGYEEAEWKALDSMLRKTLDAGVPAAPKQTIGRLRGWVDQARQTARQPEKASDVAYEAEREVSCDTLLLYLVRLLNEWVPAEVARLSIGEAEDGWPSSGISALAVANATERLLLRERLSPGSLEALLETDTLSPRLVYPADYEILQDVALFLLRRTEATALPILPAVLLSQSPEPEPLPASLSIAESGAEELRVPVAPSQLLDLLKTNPVRIGSVALSMDGRLWQAAKLQRGDQDSIVYEPTGRFRIDYSEDHARLTIPWPESRIDWAGPVGFPDRLEIFGKKWRVVTWEQDIDRTWLHLEFAGSLPLTSIEPAARQRLRRSHPASVDMAWASLENALANSVAQRSRDPIEQLRRDELVPLGRALFGLAESLAGWRPAPAETVETRLNAVRYLSAEVAPTYGPTPWRILPAPVRNRLLTHREYAPFRDLLDEVFAGLPARQRSSPSPRAA